MPLFWLSTAFLAGIVCTKGLIVPPLGWLGTAGLMICAAFFLRRRASTPPWIYIERLPLPLLMAAFCLGAARFSWARPALDASSLAWHNGRSADVILEGILVEPPSVRDERTYLKISVSSIRDMMIVNSASQPVHGMVRVSTSAATDLRYGDVLRLRGRLRAPVQIESFDYAGYLAVQGVSSIIQNPEIDLLRRDTGSRFWTSLFACKARFLSTTYQILPDPEASLLAGILLGEDNNIPPALVKAFQDTGTSHIIAISGFNIGIVAGLFSKLFGGLLGRRKGFWVSVLGITLYTLLVGAGASVVRAAVMGGLGLFARQIGRRQDGLNTLAFTAAVMCLWNPYLPWDVSFQLSFAATLGLILYAQPFSDAFGLFAGRFLPSSFYNRISRPVSEYFLFTLAAQLTTLPLILIHFQRLSLSSLLVNPLVLPAQPPVMILGGVAVFFGALFLPLGKAASVLIYPFLLYTNRLVEGFASLSGGVFSVDSFPVTSAILFYALLFGLTFFSRRFAGVHRWFSPAFCSVGLCVLTVAVWQAALRAPDGRLSLTALNTGGGNAVLLQSPGGRIVLIGGGARPSLLSASLGRRLPFFARSVDYWIPIGSRSEQIKALFPLLERYPPKAVLWAGKDETSATAQEFIHTILENEIRLTDAETGQTLDLGDGTRLDMLQVSEKSSAFAISYGNLRVAVISGSEKPQEGRTSSISSAQALLFLGQPSEKDATSWMQVLRPVLVLLPSPKMYATLNQNPSSPPNLGSYADGTWVKLISDGNLLWAEEGEE